MVHSFAKNDSTPISKYFKAREFDCPCLKCEETLIDDELVLMLDKMRDLAAIPLKINSGYRCKDHQADLKARGYETAPGVSAHELGNGADVSALMNPLTGEQLEAFAKEAGFTRFGVGLHFIHVDRKEGSARWVYKSKQQ